MRKAAPESAVTFDNHSLSINGQRVFLQSGEFHTWRLPVPDLWPDIVQKTKALGLNGLSIYVNWALVSPTPEVETFDGILALQSFFDAAKEAGIWVTFRPGPYINAETSAGGIPGWVIGTSPSIRDNETEFYEAWRPYIAAVSQIVAENQVDQGGPIILVQIENEFAENNETLPYFRAVEETMRSNGVTVPFTFNDASSPANFVNEVDIYSYDYYPLGFDCSHPNTWPDSVATNYLGYHEATNPNEPNYIPEFQGGSFSYWGGPSYNDCEILVGPEFTSVYYRNNWAQNVKMESFYMLYGGTSWGQLAFPGVYTSYDYGAAIREERNFAPKADELKLQSLFLRSIPDFAKTNQVGNTSTTKGYTDDDESIFVSELRNPDSSSGFYIIRQNKTSSTSTKRFSLEISSGTAGEKTIGPIVLHGRQSKVIPVDVTSSLAWSTAQIFWYGTIGSRSVTFLYADKGDQADIALHNVSSNAKVSGMNAARSNQTEDGEDSVFSIEVADIGITAIEPNIDQLVLVSDPVTAASFWNPTISGSGPLGSYYGIGTNQTVLVGGPYLVRNASLSGDGSELALVGDLNSTTILSVLAGEEVKTITWNGSPVNTNGTSLGFITGTIEYKPVSFNPPDFKSLAWKWKDSLPEINSTYDDSCWIHANNKTSNSLTQPPKGQVSLSVCDYGYCQGNFLFRGHFNATTRGSETGIKLTVQGGEGFAASVWLNSDWIGSTYGNQSNDDSFTTRIYKFPSESLRAGKENIVTVLSESMGLEESGGTPKNESVKTLRGISFYQLQGGNSTINWKVQGNVGGWERFPDKARTIANEGGLYGERAGWHLPEFPDNSWDSGSPFDKKASLSAAGVRFYRTAFDLDLPSGYDIPISFEFPPINSTFMGKARIQLYVNGWQMGKMVSYYGPQNSFPVHEGILDYHGTNTLALSIWATEAEGTQLESLKLSANQSYQGGISGIRVNNPPWKDRSGLCL